VKKKKNNNQTVSFRITEFHVIVLVLKNKVILNVTSMPCTGRQFYTTFVSVLILNVILFCFHISNLKNSLEHFSPRDSFNM